MKKINDWFMVFLFIILFFLFLLFSGRIFLSLMLSIFFIMTWRMIIDINLFLSNKIDEVNNKIIKQLEVRKNAGRKSKKSPKDR